VVEPTLVDEERLEIAAGPRLAGKHPLRAEDALEAAQRLRGGEG